MKTVRETGRKMGSRRRRRPKGVKSDEGGSVKGQIRGQGEEGGGETAKYPRGSRGQGQWAKSDEGKRQEEEQVTFYCLFFLSFFFSFFVVSFWLGYLFVI